VSSLQVPRDLVLHSFVQYVGLFVLFLILLLDLLQDILVDTAFLLRHFELFPELLLNLIKGTQLDPELDPHIGLQTPISDYLFHQFELHFQSPHLFIQHLHYHHVSRIEETEQVVFRRNH
jgi:hypothetical protein